MKVLVEDEEGKSWMIEFTDTSMIRVYAEELIPTDYLDLPTGGLLEASDSAWIEEIKGRSINCLDIRHFIVFCYDHLFEVAAKSVTIVT